MGESMKLPISESSPPALVEYYPEGRVLLIENGQMSEAGEEMSENIIVHYDKDEPDARSLVVAIRIDSAEFVLRPFADAILAKYGVWRETEAGWDSNALLKRKTEMQASAKYPIWESPPPARVEYCPDRRSLLIDSGLVGVVSTEMAQDIIVHYDKDEPNAPSSAVAIRIDRAEYVLKPFVDAILAKYGVTRDGEQEPVDIPSKADVVLGD